MADGVRIQLQGARDTVAAFKDLRDYVSKTALRRAVREAAKIMQTLIEDLAPFRTGRLKSNIAVRIRVTRETIRGRVIINTRGKPEDPKNAFYWRFLEKGWRTVRGVIKRFPFVSVAYEGRKQQAAQQVVDEMDKAIKRAERKAKRFGVTTTH
jgi:HK97 gp10 family phage protein